MANSEPLPSTVIRNGLTWQVERTPDAIRLVLWDLNHYHCCIVDICEMPQSRFDYEMKKGWIKNV